MTTFLLIIGALALSLATVWLFMKPTPAAAVAFVGLWALERSGYCLLSGRTLLFWAIMVLILQGIEMARGTVVKPPLKMRCYVAGGALTLGAAGTLAGTPGASFGPLAGMVIGAVAGVLLGALAYKNISRVAADRHFRSALLAIGAPDVVSVCLIVMAVLGIIAKNI